MIPFFKHKGTWDALERISKTRVVKLSEWPKGIIDDLKRYDEATFFFHGKHDYFFVDDLNSVKPRRSIMTKKDIQETWDRLLWAEDLKYTLHRAEVDCLTDFCLDAFEAGVKSERTAEVYDLVHKFIAYLTMTEKIEKAKNAEMQKNSGNTDSKKKSKKPNSASKKKSTKK